MTGKMLVSSLVVFRVKEEIEALKISWVAVKKNIISFSNRKKTKQ